MAEVVGIKFREDGRIYSFGANGIKLNQGDYAVVETARGTECGMVAKGNHNLSESELVKPLKPVLRAATGEDIKKLKENKEKEKKAFSQCEEKIANHKLEMKLVDVEISFDGSKMIFYFTADGRVDFRDLVKDLASTFHTRIELRQIGVRDEAKILGGLGICGQPLCCSRFLDDFQPVSIKMAKEQGLSLNPTKISGACGRLMCCLNYEQEGYEQALKKLPKVGAIVNTPSGKGKVESLNILKGIVYVRLDDTQQGFAEFSGEDIKVLKNNNQSHHDEIDDELLKELEEN